MAGARRSRQHDSDGGSGRRWRAQCHNQAGRSARRTTSGSSRSSPTRLRDRVIGRCTRFHEARRPCVAGAGGEATRCRPNRGWKACSPTRRRDRRAGAPGKRRSATRSARGRRSRTRRDRDQRRPSRRAAGRIDPRVEAERRTDDLYRHVRDDRRGVTGCGSKQCPIGLPRGDPAATPTATSGHRPGRQSRRSPAAPAATERRSTSRPCRSTTRRGVRPWTCWSAGLAARVAGAWDQRAARDDPPAAPRGAEGGASVRLRRDPRDAAHRAGGRLDRPGRRRFRLAATVAADRCWRDRSRRFGRSSCEPETVPPMAPDLARTSASRRRRRSRPATLKWPRRSSTCSCRARW